jgi:hypothetical protein
MGRFYLLLDLCTKADCQTKFVYLLINTIAMTAMMKYINSGLILDFILPPQNITLSFRDLLIIAKSNLILEVKTKKTVRNNYELRIRGQKNQFMSFFESADDDPTGRRTRTVTP